MRCGWVAIAIVLLIAGANSAPASEPVLSIEIGATKHSFTRKQLLESPFVTEIDVTRDATYKRPMRYHAIAIGRLLAGMDLPKDQVLEAVATDGFIGMLPAESGLAPWRRRGPSLPRHRAHRCALAAVGREDRECWAFLRRLDDARGVRNPHRAMAVSGGGDPQRGFSGKALARAERRPFAAGRRPHSRRTNPFRDPVSRLSSAQRGR